MTGLSKVESVSTVLYNEFIQYADPYYFVNTTPHTNWTYDVTSLTVNLPVPPSNYSFVKAVYFIDGGVDDLWELYQNNTLIKVVHGKWNSIWLTDENAADYLIRIQDTTEINVTEQNINLSIKAWSNMEPTAVIIYESYIKVLTKSK